MKIREIAALIIALMMALLCCAQALGEMSGPLQEGDTGAAVTALQERLIALGYLEKEADGVYDRETREAVMLFQSRNDLLETGIADRVTIEVLMSESAVQNAPEKTGDWIADYEEPAEGAWYESVAFAVATAMPNAAYGVSASVRGYAAEPPFSTDEYTLIHENGFISVRTNPLSTFAADVDTSSYAQLRRRILQGEKVPADSVRIEEMLNYFSYDYRQPSGSDPLGVTLELADCPWNEKTKLLQIGLQAPTVTKEERKPLHLVFLIDTSGSMEGKDRLDLVKRAFLLLLDELNPEDTVSIVAYASQERVVLEGVRASEKTTIMNAIETLEAGGYTNGSAGLIRAYEVAEKYLQKDGIGRILLATDGDLNVGTTSESELARLVSEKKKSGIGLTCLGFGMGNYKDNKMEALADYGDGNCWYIDTIHEARKALVTEGGGTFVTVAKDVKLQLDFNPARVKGYRLIGYEDRVMAAEDFANDEKDGGEIGSGHRVTVLYEIVPADSDFEFGAVESRYETTAASGSEEWLTLSIRAKEPDGQESRLYTYPLSGGGSETMSDNMKFAAAVAETGMLLRGSEWAGTSSWDSALALMRDCGAVNGDPYKEEFLYMVTLLQRGE